ncbi:MAG: GTPase HflX [Pseudomonadota bacterium]
MAGFVNFETPRTKAAVLVPIVSYRASGTTAPNGSARDGSALSSRSAEAQLDEARGLASAIDLDVIFTDVSNLNEIRPATLYGSGKVEALQKRLEENDIKLVIVDHSLTPVQQRNLERALNVKVLDRTGLILEIFGARAQTKEGRLQVDLAALRYQRGRLVRSWTHLERQRGGGGFLGGPGETQIEADRRALQTKIERLERQLEDVRRTRALHRKQRKKQDMPVVAFVGYTNAGKSTLFNRITTADVMAKDLLFATLDPTLRRIELPQGSTAIISDTVGFISNLPTDLVAAFRATLEEVTEADVIVHVRDIAHEDSEAQADDVASVLRELSIDISDAEGLSRQGRSYIELWNKIDLLPEEERDRLKTQAANVSGYEVATVSALSGEGIEQCLGLIEACLNRATEVRNVTLGADDLAHMHVYYTHGSVIDRKEDPSGSVELTVRSDRWNKIQNLIKENTLYY